MKNIFKFTLPVAALALTMGMTSCTKDLDIDPIDPNLSTELNLDGLYLKCYANLALPGNGGANGDSDIDGYDGGTAGFIRQLFNSNELPTDESICCWGDPGIAGFNFNQYDASHPMMHMYYYRLTTGINYCNSYLNEAGDGETQKRAEVRFLRALQYYMLMDAFGNIPFTTSLEKPSQISRQEAYNWIENELLEAEPDLMDAKAMKSTDAQYGCATKGAAWMLLARLYLNAEVYTGTPQWAKAAEYAKKVIDANYQLHTNGNGVWSAYQMLFMADNGETNAAYEAVFPILQDGSKTTSWGGTLFCIASCFDNSMHANIADENATNNTDQAWGGNRARPELIKKFFPLENAPENLQSYDMAVAAGDDRALFCSAGHTYDVEKVTEFTNGYGVAKWTNFTSDGSAAHNASFPDTDFFLFRLPEAYLTYAEATARTNGGQTTSEGTDLINKLRSRANASTRSNTSYSLDDIIDEWAREFYYEGRRRVDLIRFGLYGGNNTYMWQWKGGSYAGTTFSKDLNVYAIPSNEIATNSNLHQNEGYK